MSAQRTMTWGDDSVLGVMRRFCGEGKTACKSVSDILLRDTVFFKCKIRGK